MKTLDFRPAKFRGEHEFWNKEVGVEVTDHAFHLTQFGKLIEEVRNVDTGKVRKNLIVSDQCLDEAAKDALLQAFDSSEEEVGH